MAQQRLMYYPKYALFYIFLFSVLYSDKSSGIFSSLFSSGGGVCSADLARRWRFG